MSTEIKSVIIAGVESWSFPSQLVPSNTTMGSGNLGRPVVNEMLKSNIKISVLTREDSTATFPYSQL